MSPRKSGIGERNDGPNLSLQQLGVFPPYLSANRIVESWDVGRLGTGVKVFYAQVFTIQEKSHDLAARLRLSQNYFSKTFPNTARPIAATGSDAPQQLCLGCFC